jgi:hypothetical protein
MKATVIQEEKIERHLVVLRSYIRQLLRDAPDFGEISISATLHEGNIVRIRLGAEVLRVVVPRVDLGALR